MKKMNHLVVNAMLALALTVPLSSLVNANDGQQGHSGYNHQHKGEFSKARFKKLARMLELSDEQKSKVQAIFAQGKTQRQAHRETMTDFKTQLEGIMTAAVFDDKAFVSLHQQYQDVFTEKALQKAKIRHALLQVLTTAQREKLMKMKRGGKGLFH